MPRFVVDKDAAQDALVDLTLEIDGFKRVLNASVVVLRRSGFSWADIGFALGVTRQAAALRFGQLQDTLDIDDEERERIERLLGVKDRPAKYEVREGDETLSRHNFLRTAHARRRPGLVVVKVYPDGAEAVVVDADGNAVAEKRDVTRGGYRREKSPTAELVKARKADGRRNHWCNATAGRYVAADRAPAGRWFHLECTECGHRFPAELAAAGENPVGEEAMVLRSHPAGGGAV